jgi:molybdopterin converting factor subunit 1
VKVNVRLFAVARQLAGQDCVEVELPEGATVARLRQELVRRIPQLSRFAPRMTFAIDTQYADDSSRISGTAEVACIPPVSGG